MRHAKRGEGRRPVTWHARHHGEGSAGPWSRRSSSTTGVRACTCGGRLRGDVLGHRAHCRPHRHCARGGPHPVLLREHQAGQGDVQKRIRKAWGQTAHAVRHGSCWTAAGTSSSTDPSHRTGLGTTGGITEDELEHHNYHHPDRSGGSRPARINCQYYLC